MTKMTDEDRDEAWSAFRDAVNMSPSEIEKWLETEESKAVGQKDGKAESVGHESGRKIIDIKHTKKTDLTDAQYAHMKKVVAYVKRHSAQRPKGDVTQTDWRYSLMNWGHDPSKS